MSSFENLRIVDNFYQTSLFFPMPTVIISTLCEDGATKNAPKKKARNKRKSHPCGWLFSVV